MADCAFLAPLTDEDGYYILHFEHWSRGRREAVEVTLDYQIQLLKEARRRYPGKKIFIHTLVVHNGRTPFRHDTDIFPRGRLPPAPKCWWRVAPCLAVTTWRLPSPRCAAVGEPLSKCGQQARHWIRLLLGKLKIGRELREGVADCTFLAPLTDDDGDYVLHFEHWSNGISERRVTL